MKTRSLVGILFVLILLLGSWAPVNAQSPDNRYFNETGHNVSGEFLKYYNRVKNAQVLFGFPITEQITARDGKTVQYFQRARFELYPDRPEGQRVGLSPVGVSAFQMSGGSDSPININNASCRIYNNFPVCYSFLEFFEKNGGVAQFGNPISPFVSHDTLIVQYFEKARLEWKPWLPEGQRVAVADLGRVFFDVNREDPNLLKAATSKDATIEILNLQTRAFVWKAVTLPDDQQLIYVIVQDQTLQPVAGATGTATVRWPAGTITNINFTTNSNGIGIVPLTFTKQPYGKLVNIDIVVKRDNIESHFTTSFRIWY